MKPSRFLLAASFVCAGGLITSALAAQQSDAPPPLPPAGVPPPAHRLPANPTPVESAPVATPAPGPNELTVEQMLKWDAMRKEVNVESGTPEGKFTFHLTNASPQDLVILSVSTSCGCTVAKLPEQPWRLTPGTNGEISVTMNLAGKSGAVEKVVTVATDHGMLPLYVKSIILPAAAMNPDDREKNQKLAQADRQAVFKGDCARCHAEPAKDKMGLALYASVCGVCHESAHRATMVPNLHMLPHETNAEFWKNWIAQGKAGTLMPAFAQAQGGILTDAQIQSLVSFLSATIPSRPATAQTPKPPASVN